MKTLTLSEFERELKTLFAAVRNGEHLVVTRGNEQIEVVPDGDLGWSPAMLSILNKPNPDWQLEPEPFERKQTSVQRNPFGEETD